MTTETTTYVCHQLLYERNHASHVMEDLHQVLVHHLDGEGIVILFLIEGSDLSVRNGWNSGVSVRIGLTYNFIDFNSKDPQAKANVLPKQSIYKFNLTWYTIRIEKTKNNFANSVLSLCFGYYISSWRFQYCLTHFFYFWENWGKKTEMA